LSFERNTSKKNQSNDSHYGLSCAKPDMQENEVNFLIDKQIKLLNVSFDEQKIIQKKNLKTNATIGSQKENDQKLKLNKKHFFSNLGTIICDPTQILRFYSLDSKRN
jgi:hypothetical protein